LDSNCALFYNNALRIDIYFINKKRENKFRMFIILYKQNACIISGPIDPDYADMLYKDLRNAEEPMVISNHLHLLYLVTPYDAVKDISPSWFIYFNQVSVL
jgi:hypothetical protein